MEARAQEPQIDYPDSDGKPMAETDVHRHLILDVTQRLEEWAAARPDTYASGNLFVYYTEGRPKVCLAPDAFVVFGVPNRRRRTFKVWDEGKWPEVVFEFTSARTQDEDLGKKFDIYQDVWGVKEYFLFDPLDEYLDPPLLGYRLVKGEFQQIKPAAGALTSKALGITIARDGPRLILRDAKTGAELLTRDEQKAAAQVAAAEQKAAAASDAVARERTAREQAEAEIARLKAELAALRKRKPTA